MLILANTTLQAWYDWFTLCQNDTSIRCYSLSGIYIKSYRLWVSVVSYLQYMLYTCGTCRAQKHKRACVFYWSWPSLLLCLDAAWHHTLVTITLRPSRNRLCDLQTLLVKLYLVGGFTCTLRYWPWLGVPSEVHFQKPGLASGPAPPPHPPPPLHPNTQASITVIVTLVLFPNNNDSNSITMLSILQ